MKPGYSSMCASGLLKNLPDHADVRFDPTKHEDNLSIVTSGEEAMSLESLRVSSVEGLLENGVAEREALIVNGSITDLPSHLSGTLLLPSTVELTTEGGDALGAADLTLRNYVLPDEIPESAPARTEFGSDTALPSADQELLLFQRGERFKAKLHVADLVAVTYAAGRDDEGLPLDTRSIVAEFDGDQTAHAFIDLIAPDPQDPDKERTVIADVLLRDLAARTELCFRGPRSTPPPS